MAGSRLHTTGLEGMQNLPDLFVSEAGGLKVTSDTRKHEWTNHTELISIKGIFQFDSENLYKTHRESRTPIELVLD